MPLLANASPNVEPDDPRYDELAVARALSLEPLHLGGVAPLTEARMRRLLAGERFPSGAWLRLDRAHVGAFFDRDRRRPYSTATRPRDITGSIAVTCERNLGRPCVGSGLVGELDASAGYGTYVSGTVRLRTNAGSQGYDPALAIDRAYVLGELGPVNVEVGRDVLVIGPRSRTRLAWGDHAPALDQVRVSTAEPIALGSSLRGNAVWAVGRLRDPQRFEGNLVSISRVQLDIVDRVEFGVVQLLQLGGEGAASIGPIDFILEHIRRRDLTASATDSSNRRFGGDLSFDVPALRGARFYYAVMFEDIRKTYWYDAVRYDADHLFGVELAAIPFKDRLHGLVLEYHQTGIRSQEHSPRVTGLTNAGRVAGAPLGPDATSLFLGARISRPFGTVYPWLEYASVANDIYSFTVDGPITLANRGSREQRYRIGSRARVPLSHKLAVEGDALIEYVDRLAFIPGVTRTNARLGISLVYRAQ